MWRNRLHLSKEADMIKFEKSEEKTMFKKIITVAATAGCCFLLLLLVYIIPVDMISQHALESAETLSTEGIKPVKFGLETDTFTDAIMIGEACYDAGIPAVQASMKSSYSRISGKNTIESLETYVKGEGEQEKSYARYWHGYLVLLKPLLVFFSYREIRILNYIVSVAAMIGIGVLMKREKMPILSIGAFYVSLFLCGIYMIPSCMQFCNMFFLLFAVLIYLLCRHERIYRDQNDVVFFCIVGMLTAFFDFLTVPLITLAIPLLFGVYLNKKSNIWKTALDSMMWGIGYGGFWALKWLLASIVLKTNVFENAWKSASVRSSMQLNETKITYRQVLSSNFECLNGFLLAVILLGCIVMFLWMVRQIGVKRTIVSRNGHMLLIGCMPLAWYFILGNHSFEHNWYTYRELLIFILGILFCMIGWIADEHKN